MKNWEMFKNRQEAECAHSAEKVLMTVTWAMLDWLYMDHIPDEPRADYLARCAKAGILKANGYAELRKLKKAARKGAVGDAAV